MCAHVYILSSRMRQDGLYVVNVNHGMVEVIVGLQPVEIEGHPLILLTFESECLLLKIISVDETVVFILRLGSGILRYSICVAQCIHSNKVHGSVKLGYGLHGYDTT